MATDKTFTVVGVSTQKGDTKVRFANDTMRIKILQKNDHTDICLIELPEAMDKLTAVRFMQGLPEFAGVAAQAAIADYLERNTPKTAKAAPAAKAPKAAKAPLAPKPTVPQVDTAKLEDAPF
jgi:hypothetical protein